MKKVPSRSGVAGGARLEDLGGDMVERVHSFSPRNSVAGALGC